jgi:hypothetical protein
MKKKSIKHENPSPSPPPIGNKIVGALTSFNDLGVTTQSIDLVFISEQILEVKPKKLPRLRKANFFTLDEPILQREIEKKL